MKQILVLLSILLCFSCNSSQYLIDRLESLVEDVKENGEKYTSEDWENLTFEYQDILTNMSELEFTSEQEKTIGKLHARFYLYAGKHISNYLENQVKEIGNSANNFIEGFMDEFDDAEHTE